MTRGSGTLLHTTAHPARWAQVSRRSITATLRAHRIRRLTTDDVVAALQRPRFEPPPAWPTRSPHASRRSYHSAARAGQRQSTDRDIERALAQLATSTYDHPRQHRGVHILRSLPGAGERHRLDAHRAAGPLAARDYALLGARRHGAVTKRSSKRTFHVQMRYACKHRLRKRSITGLADTSLRAPPRVLRCLEARVIIMPARSQRRRSLARILIAMLNTGTLYDASRFNLESN